MSPSVEQTDKAFMFYIKQKFRDLSSFDCTVMLLGAEIHLKSFFGYKGGNIVSTSFNSPSEAAKSALLLRLAVCFLLTRMLYTYCLQAK